MKENLIFAWIASWFALLGQLLFFICVALYTGQWMYTVWSFMVSMSVGVPSMIRTWQAHKRREHEQTRKELVPHDGQ